MDTLLIFLLLLFFQEDITSTQEGVPYTPTEGVGGWLLAIVAVITVGVVAFVVVRVFKGIQRSRTLERMAEDANASKSDGKKL